MIGRALLGLVVLAGCAPGATPPATTQVPTSTPTSAPATSSTSKPPGQSTTSSTVPKRTGAVLVFGDWGSGTDEQAEVAGAMAEYAEENPVTAMLTTGDNFYSDNVTLVLEPMQWVFQRDIEFWITWGNHDVETSTRIGIVEEALGSPPRWTVHEWGRVDVVILDSNQVGSADQLQFLTETLAGSDDPTIVVFHHPPLSCSSHGDTVSVLESWVPHFDEDVVLVLSGHDHNYQRFEDAGITYVVSGGGGQSLYDLRSCPADHPDRLAGEEVFHFLVLTQTKNGISVDAVDTDLATIDSFEVPLPWKAIGSLPLLSSGTAS